MNCSESTRSVHIRFSSTAKFSDIHLIMSLIHLFYVECAAQLIFAAHSHTYLPFGKNLRRQIEVVELVFFDTGNPAFQNKIHDPKQKSIPLGMYVSYKIVNVTYFVLVGHHDHLAVQSLVAKCDAKLSIKKRRMWSPFDIKKMPL